MLYASPEFIYFSERDEGDEGDEGIDKINEISNIMAYIQTVETQHKKSIGAIKFIPLIW
jgi:hypothetical protein